MAKLATQYSINQKLGTSVDLGRGNGFTVPYITIMQNWLTAVINRPYANSRHVVIDDIVAGSGYVFDCTNPSSFSFNITNTAQNCVAQIDSYLNVKSDANKVSFTANYPSWVNSVSIVSNGDGSYTTTASVQANTGSARNGTVSLTQATSGYAINLNIFQDSGTFYTYTVYSSRNGATVKFDGTVMGTIVGGVFSTSILEGNSAYYVTLEGNLPPDDNYVFSVDPTSMNFGVSGGLQNYTLTSLRTKYYWAPESLSRNSSVTINPTAQPYSGGFNIDSYPDWLSIGIDAIQVGANPNTTSRSGNVVFSQSDRPSNKATIAITQSGVSIDYTYTIESNIIGATVYFDGISKGTINSSGEFSTTITNGDTYYNVTLSGGTLPTNTYTFNVSPVSKTFSSASQGATAVVTSVKTAFSIPSQGQIYRDATLIMNAAETESYPTFTEASNATWLTSSYPSYNVTANTGTSTRYGTLTYTQAESNNTATIAVTQTGADPSYSYTVYYDVEGASVYFDGTLMGTISGGYYETNITNGDVYYNVSFSGGDLNPSWSITPSTSNVNFGNSANSTNINISSVKTTYSHNTGTVNRGSSVTLVRNFLNATASYSWSEAETWLTVSGSDGTSTITVTENTGSTRSTTIDYYCPESIESAQQASVLVTVNQSGGGSYTYTVYSNIEGANVYFDGILQGTISSGTLLVSITNGNSSYSVTVSGGTLPAESYVLGTSPFITGITTDYQGGTISVPMESYRKTYAYPVASTVSRNGTITMNYTTANVNESYKLKPILDIWFRGNVETNPTAIIVDDNTGGVQRLSIFEYVMVNYPTVGSNIYTLEQDGDPYTFYSDSTDISIPSEATAQQAQTGFLHSYKTISSVITGLEATAADLPNGSWIGSASVTSVGQSGDDWICELILYDVEANTTSLDRSIDLVVTQEESGKTVTYTIVQAGIDPYVLEVLGSSDQDIDGTTTIGSFRIESYYWIPMQPSVRQPATAVVTQGDSWLSVLSIGDGPTNNTIVLNYECIENLGAPRVGKILVTQSVSGKTLELTVRQSEPQNVTLSIQDLYTQLSEDTIYLFKSGYTPTADRTRYAGEQSLTRVWNISYNPANGLLVNTTQVNTEFIVAGDGFNIWWPVPGQPGIWTGGNYAILSGTDQTVII